MPLCTKGNIRKKTKNQICKGTKKNKQTVFGKKRNPTSLSGLSVTKLIKKSVAKIKCQLPPTAMYHTDRKD